MFVFFENLHNNNLSQRIVSDNFYVNLYFLYVLLRKTQIKVFTIFIF